MAAGEISLEEFAGVGTAPIQPAAAPAKSEISLEEFAGVPTEKSKWGDLLKSNAATAAAVGDFAWGIVTMPLGVGADIGARIAGGVTGQDRRISAQAGQLASEAVTEPIANPLQKLMTTMGYGEDYKKSDVTQALTKFATWLDKGGQWIEDHTGGHLLKEDVASLTNVLMTGALSIRKGGLLKPETLAEKGAKTGSAGTENRLSYITPEDVQVRASEADAAVTTPPAELQAQALSREAQLNGSLIDPLTPTDTKAPGRAEQLGGQPAEPRPEPSQIGTVDESKLPSGRALTQAYDSLPGGTEPAKPVDLQAPRKVAGWWAGEFDKNPVETYEKPSFGERFKRAYLEDIHWSPNKTSALLGAAITGGVLLDPDKYKELGAVGLAGGAMLAVKGKGGMWHPEAVERLSSPIWEALTRHPVEEVNAAEHATWQKGREDLAERMVRNYLNKHAGTEGDPLKGVEIPSDIPGQTWGGAWDSAINSSLAEWRGSSTSVPGAKAGEQVWDITANDTSSRHAITSYLSHVGDYLRQKVAPEKLQQYDLVRAVKETKKWDDELAKKMNSVEGRMEGTVPYKEYPDKFQWVEVKSPEALKHEGDMMGHCVGGYCDYVASGETKIYSLRDPKGGSHVTVEVAPEPSPGTREYAAWHELHDDDPGAVVSPDGIRKLPSIVQIKGKQNRAPAPEYLPYVQDFVKSGKWGEVGDIQNAGLHDLGTHATNRFVTEVELPPEKRLGPRNQQGSADPRLLARLAAIGVGATAGAWLDDNQPLRGAVLGALGAAVASKMSPRAAVEMFKKATAPDSRIRVDNLANAWETQVGRASLAAWQLQQHIEKLVPDLGRRKAITQAIDSNNYVGLNASERSAATMLRDALAQAGSQAKDAGVLRDTIQNYITHLWGPDGAKKIQELVNRTGGPNMSPESRFALTRKFSTLEAGKAAGLVPLTEDASAIAGIYLNSISRSMTNKQLLGALKAQVDKVSGLPVVESTAKAPEGYVKINHPQLQGLMVHPDIAPSLRFVFDASEPGTIMRALEGVSIATKRSAVSFSLFHAKALLDAYVGGAKANVPMIAGGAAASYAIGSATENDPITAAMIGAGIAMMLPGSKHIAQAALPKVFGENKYLKALRENDPKMAEVIDLSIQGGLKYQLRGKTGALEDVYGTHDQFYRALQGLQKYADSVVPGAGTVVKGVEKVNKAMDGFMWERLHAGMKLQVFSEKYETLMQNNAKANAANPKVPLKSKEQLAQIAASYTNDLFGGLNWRRVAEAARTKWGRDISLGAFSATGRRVMQVALFAPDWTISTFRAAWGAFGKGSGFKGIVEPTELADLHRQYIARSALYYTAMGDGLNYSMTGHHVWDNKDPTTIDMGDGRTMQWSKHTMEPVHWLTKPAQQGLNKLGYLPKVAAEAAFNKEYLSTGNAPKMQEPLPLHMLHRSLPIAVGQQFEGGTNAGIAGFLGVPIYGKTNAQRSQEKEQRKLERQLRSGGFVRG